MSSNMTEYLRCAYLPEIKVRRAPDADNNYRGTPHPFPIPKLESLPESTYSLPLNLFDEAARYCRSYSSVSNDPSDFGLQLQ